MGVSLVQYRGAIGMYAGIASVKSLCRSEYGESCGCHETMYSRCLYFASLSFMQLMIYNLYKSNIQMQAHDIESNPGPRSKKQSAEQKKKADKFRKQVARLQEPKEKTQLRHEKDSMRKMKAKMNETTEQSQLRREKNSIQKMKARLDETPQQSQLRRENDRIQKMKSMLAETPEQSQLRRENDRIQKMKAMLAETPEQSQLRRENDRIQKMKAMLNENREHSKLRLEAMRDHSSRSRLQQTKQQTELRLEQMKDHAKRSRSQESKEQTQLRRNKETLIKRKVRQDEPKEIASIRREGVNTCMKNLRKRKLEQLVECTPDEIAVIEQFLINIKQASDYVCCSCHRLMYRQNVVLLKRDSYAKDPEIVNRVLAYSKQSVDGKEWMCRTCHATLKKGKIPVQAKCNNLTLMSQPDVLKDLNLLELRLVAQRIPFMKMVGLPRGKQYGIHGPAVNVPSKLDFVCKQFPRLPSEAEIIPMKLKRKMEYKSHYMYEYVRPEKVMTALKWLKVNNLLYKDIQINDNWCEESVIDNQELWNAMIHCSDNRPKEICKEMSKDMINDSVVNVCSVETKYNTGFELLCVLAAPKGFDVVDVPRDGDCLFSSVCYHLNDVCPKDLRKQLAKFMRENELFSHYRDFLSERIEMDDILNADTERPNDQDRAISEVEDLETRKELRWLKYLDNLESGAQWGEHLAVQGLAEMLKLEIHIIATENPDMEPIYPLDGIVKDEIYIGLIHQYHYVALDKRGRYIIASNEEKVPNDCSTEAMDNSSEYNEDLDCVWQYNMHDSKNDKLDCIWEHRNYNMDDSENNELDCVWEHRNYNMNDSENDELDCVWKHHSSELVESDAECEEWEHGSLDGIADDVDMECLSSSSDDEDFQDQMEFKKIVNTCGLPHETSLIRENSEFVGKQISIAPAELEKPVPLLSDKHFEELAHPDKYPDGSNALTADRPVNITPRKFFNQRLLDADGRFAQSIEYLLGAQYAVESNQVQSAINQVVFRQVVGRKFQGNTLNVGLVKDRDKLQQLVKCDNAYRFMKQVRGSPAYFHTMFYDVLAMVRQLGIPTWFFTVSAADMQWPDLIQTIARQYGTTLSDEDVKNLTFEQRSLWLRSNPVTAARHFQYRVECLFKDVLKSNAKPLGHIIDWVIRIEFQARGSPHAHTMLWVKDAPKVDVNSDEEICTYVDKHVSCVLPDDDPYLKELVLKLQNHNHSAYCRRKGSCRFNFPKPPSPCTILAREPDDEYSEAIKSNAKDILRDVRDVLTDDKTPDEIELTDLLAEAKVSEDDYLWALEVSHKGSNIVLRRKPSEKRVNGYNPMILKAWQANIDVQFIVDPYACIMYIASYISKGEQGMGDLLKQVSKECRELDIKAKLRRLGSVFLNHRELSAQEATYRILSLPMRKFSRKVIFVNTDPIAERSGLLKSSQELEDMDDDDEDIFHSNIIVRYADRPNCLESMCLANFAANYSTSYAEYDDNVNDNVPDILQHDIDEQVIPYRDQLPKQIKLRNGKTMHKRKQEAVIRFRKFNSEKQSSNMYRAKLMLYLPWRIEETDLIGGYESFRAHYDAVADQIRDDEARFTENLDLVNAAIADNELYGPPEHIWADIAPGTEHANEQDVEEGIVIDRNIEQEDLIANAAMIEKPCDKELAARYRAESVKDFLPPAEYRRMIRDLNEKQRQIVFYHRQWCKKAVIALRNNKPVQPYRMFLSGPGGVGKSHVIKLIHSDTRKLLALSNRIKPTDVTVLLTAPTGVASFNIGGMTVHSALLLRTTRYGKEGAPLTFDKLNTVRSKLENLHLIIIDEVSMVGSDMLLNIHKRLNEIKGVAGDDVWFGQVSVLAVGDLYQLPPVMQSPIFEPVNDPMARLYASGSLWNELFEFHELDEIMRQKDDLSFAEMLCRIRVGQVTSEDIETLKSREVTEEDENYPAEAMHVFARNIDVDKHNKERLNHVATADEQITIDAFDDKTDSTGQLDLEKLQVSKKRENTGGLETCLIVAVGARVMMTVNVNTADGLVNGVMGTVVSVIRNNNNKVICVLVEFDHQDAGKNAIASSQWKETFPNAVPVVRHETGIDKGGCKGTSATRRQFPLRLAWAVTIHKCQGLTLDKIVVSMKGAKKFGSGQAYVAFSRVRSLADLFITDFDSAGIRTDGKVILHMEEMEEKQMTPVKDLQMMNLPRPEWFTVGHLNVHYFLDKMKDLNTGKERDILNKTDIMCFTETYLATNHNIASFLDQHNYISFRQDVPTENNHGGLHGVMICVSATLNPRELTLVTVDNLESRVVVVETDKSRLTVAAVYRKPSMNMALFLQLLDNLLSLMPLQIPTVVVGDFNDNLDGQEKSTLVSFMERYGFRQNVHQPTTDRGSTLDHIYFNRPDEPVIVDIHDVYYSDHDSVFLTINCV